MSLNFFCPLYATEPTYHRHNQAPCVIHLYIMTIDHKEVLAVLLSIFFCFFGHLVKLHSYFWQIPEEVAKAFTSFLSRAPR